MNEARALLLWIVREWRNAMCSAAITVEPQSQETPHARSDD